MPHRDRKQRHTRRRRPQQRHTRRRRPQQRLRKKRNKQNLRKLRDGAWKSARRWYWVMDIMWRCTEHHKHLGQLPETIIYIEKHILPTWLSIGRKPLDEWIDSEFSHIIEDHGPKKTFEEIIHRFDSMVNTAMILLFVPNSGLLAKLGIPHPDPEMTEKLQNEFAKIATNYVDKYKNISPKAAAAIKNWFRASIKINQETNPDDIADAVSRWYWTMKVVWTYIANHTDKRDLDPVALRIQEKNRFDMDSIGEVPLYEWLRIDQGIDTSDDSPKNAKIIAHAATQFRQRGTRALLEILFPEKLLNPEFQNKKRTEAQLDSLRTEFTKIVDGESIKDDGFVSMDEIKENRLWFRQLQNLPKQ